MYKIIVALLLSVSFAADLISQEKTVDIFIIAGQSNATGRGIVSDLSDEQKTQNVQFFGSWHKFINNATSDSPQYHSGWLDKTIAGETRAGISTQNNGNYSEIFGNSDWFGPEMGFAKRASEINLTSNPIGILKYTVDGSALIADPATTYQVSDWDTTKTGFSDGDCWRGFQTALSAAVSNLPEGTTPNFKGMIWWQGENGTNATDLKVFIAAVRNHLGTNFGVQDPSQFPIIITGNDFWGAGLKANVADLDDYVGFIDSVTYGQIGGYTNTHIGSGENGQSLDVDGNGINDMFDIGEAYADEMALLIDSENVEDPVDTPPTETSSSISLNLVQSANSGQGTTSIDLTGHGNIDWAAWNGGNQNPSQTMSSGSGFNSFTALGSTTFNSGSFYGQNKYSWTNGSPTISGSTSLAGSASFTNIGDGAKLKISIATAGSYQLKFYITTYDVNLSAKASLSSGIVNDTINGSYVGNSVQRYEYTIDFSTEGADTLNFEVAKSGGASFIVAQEAFSLKRVIDNTQTSTYKINFINVDGSQTSQTVNEGAVVTPPEGVSTADKTFTAWPTIAPATADATYTALYEEVVTGGGNIVDVFIATGQSNAAYPLNDGDENKFAFGRGIQAALTESGLFSNPTVVLAGEPSRPIAYWWAEFWPGAYNGYDSNFFDINSNGLGQLEAKINEIIANGDTPRFRGLFWFQGESDGLGPYATADTSQTDYENRWNGLLAQLDTDLQAVGVNHRDYKFIVNTVAESGDKINSILNYIANQGTHSDKGAIYDAENSQYHDQDVIVEANYGNLHDYDHVKIGRANAQLFINTFLNAQPPTENTYSITFINVDGSQTSQTVKEGIVATPPEGVNTSVKTFTAWPTIAPATADATYTALYQTSNSTAGVSLTLSQTTNAGQGITSIDLTSTGGLDWAAWNGGSSTPNQSMAGGSGFSGFSSIGNTSFGNGFFNSQNKYSWINGLESTTSSTTLSGNSTLASVGDGVRLTVDVSSAGTYQLKFYASTYDVNLSATVTLSSMGITDSINGNYVSNSVEKYEYTVEFTTTSADTLTLDMVKSDGASFILAQEAFSLKALNIVDGNQTTTEDTQNSNNTEDTQNSNNTEDTQNSNNTEDIDNNPFIDAILWDGEGGDNLWSTALNWSTDLLPGTEDDIYVGTSALLTGASSSFASIYIDSDSYVSFADFYPNSKIFNINGTLDLDSVTAFRPYGSYFHLSSTASFGSSIQWLDLGTNSVLSFVDGALFQAYTSLEVRGPTSIDFKLSENGFTTLELGGLYDGNVASWSDFTFNVDISEYDLSNGSEIILIDFSAHASVFSGSFTPTAINIQNGDTQLNGILSFDISQSRLILTINNINE